MFLGDFMSLKSKTSRFLSSQLALAFGLVCFLGLGNPMAQYVNPLKGDDGAHDPMMIKDGDNYYVFYTGNGIQVKTSKDKITWKNIGSVFPTMPAWHKTTVPGSSSSLWAPDVHFANGKFWLYYSVSAGGRVSAIGLATATTLNPAGGTTWQDQGVIISTTNSNDFNAIDPNVYLDSTQTPWMVFGSWWTGIKMFQLDATTGKRVAGSEQLAIAYHKNGAEGAFLIKHDKYYYLWLSWDNCCKGASSDYNIRVGRSSQLTGGYVDSKGVTLPNQGGDLIDAGDTRWHGPGHNAIFVDGDTTFLVNHAYDANSNGRATLQIRPLYWTSLGWPTLDKTKGTIGTGPTTLAAPAKTLGRSAKKSRAYVDLQGRWAYKNHSPTLK
jgi:arabinan endo-1,5-alpha-L-arabinosidase